VTARASAPVVGVALLVLATVVAAGAVGAGLLATDPPDPPPRPALSLDADGRQIAITHHGGDPLDVRKLTVRVEVDGTPLAHQPPVPFFAARGFRGGPTGPFNSAADPLWTPGETASVRVAATNDPTPSAGARVTVAVYHEEQLLARLTAVA